MSKEIYISSTPHETRLAIVEDDNLSEIYYERENEYTLAGSIYNGKVTRVLPGMQSAFVDIGLERDAFLYITDFMEEVPDAAEFDTGSASEHPRPVRVGNGDLNAPDRGERGDRGSRGRRGGRDRNRGERNGQNAIAPEPSASLTDIAQTPSSETYSETASAPTDPQFEDSGAVDGSRRWRGRRGRRRGRGNTPSTDPSQAGLPGDAAAVRSDDPDLANEDETLFEGGASLDQGQQHELGASAEPNYPLPQSGDRPRARRDRDRFDRNRRRGLGSRPEQGSDAQSEQRTENADLRGSVGERQRFPRGFAPSRNRYGVEDSELNNNSQRPAEPIILPGESLSKYRKGGDAPAPASAGSTAAQSSSLSRPANLVEVAVGWDGSDVLPGETLSRRPRPQVDSAQQVGRRRDPSERTRRRPQGTPAGAESAPVVHVSTDPPQGRSEQALPEDLKVTPPDVEDPELNQTPSDSAEFEPIGGSASYRVDPLAPAEFRLPTPAYEDETTDAPLPEDSSAGDSHASIAHSITPSPDEPLKPIETFSRGAEEIFPSSRPEIVQTTESASIPAAAAAESENSTATHDLTSINDSGEMHSHPETPDAPEARDLVSAEPENEAFSPGEDLIEEFLDEEEPATTLHASAFEVLDDLDEETVEGGAELNSMLRDMSIDQITGAGEPNEDLEDFEEDDLQQDVPFGQHGAEEEMHEEIAPHEHGSLEPAAEQQDDSRSESVAARRFGAEDESAYERYDAPVPDGDPNRQIDRVRRDRRDPRRSGGRPDRRAGQGGGDRGGRSRHSVQSTNLPAISDLLKPGQEILVQIAKEPIAKKGARITSHIALPGRFLVFMPTVNHTGVSRKIESDSERRRLKEILLSEKGDASGGFIVRTAASGASEEELRSDLRFLLNLWSDIKSRSESSKSPALIYHDLNLIERILRDQVTDSFSAIWVDSETEYERVLRFLQRFQPSLIRRVKLYSKEIPLFEQFGISEEINKALRSKVWLKSGGSIVINQTEALVAIDINTGKYVGKTARLEDTIVKTNLDAIPEIVRQIRLRDLGGIIIIDFIDMDERKNRNRVMAALEEELKNDRAPSKVLQFNDFGLVAITRKRVKQSLERTLSTPCNICQGTGMTKSPITVCNDIYVELRKMHKHLDRGDVMLRVHPEVVKQLKASNARWLHEMEEMVGKTLLVKSDPSLHPEQFDIH